jgi:hypothetical protein
VLVFLPRVHASGDRDPALPVGPGWVAAWLMDLL